jgi:hypothetical protein
MPKSKRIDYYPSSEIKKRMEELLPEGTSASGFVDDAMKFYFQHHDKKSMNQWSCGYRLDSLESRMERLEKADEQKQS